MSSDPRPHTARKPNGDEDTDLEERFRVLFAFTKGTDSPKPTDLASALVFLQELHARLNARQGA
jgi:hypothetical protein